MTTSNPALLIDDDTSVLRGLRRALSAKMPIEICTSGEDAILAVESGKEFSVFICDQQMPGLSGIGTLETLREKAPSVPRILLTGHADRQTLRDGINRAGLFRIIEKPCSLAMLEEAISDALSEETRLKEKHRAIEKTVLGTILMLRDISIAFGLSPGENRARISELAHHIVGQTSYCPVWVIDAALILSNLDKLFELAETCRGRVAVKTDMNDFGPSLLKHVSRMKPVGDALYFKEKHFDGSGFPANLISEDTIPGGARLLTLLLGLETLLDNGLSEVAAFEEMRSASGIYDPALMIALSRLIGDEGIEDDTDTPETDADLVEDVEIA